MDTNDRMTISVVIITLNEEKNIERCLGSLMGTVDEIIVVDSFSSDKTEEICKRFSVKFIQRPWEGYSATKNYGNSMATGSYILSIDADEALSENMKKKLLKLKDSRIEADAFYFNRLTNYCGKWIHHCGWYPDRKLRLWKKEKGNWEGLIHEKVVLRRDCKVENLKCDILHYSYYSVKDHVKQMLLFTEIMARDNFQRKKKANWIKVFLSPVAKFISSYFFRLGFLDGYYGLVICIMSSHASFLKYLRTRELEKEGRAS